MNIPVIFEDDDILAINKPSGMVVNRAESVRTQTVQDWLDQNKSTNLQINKSTNDNSDFISRSGIVHRIDKETSGILLIAKNPRTFSELQRQFKERLIHKTYLAIVHGILTGEGEINVPVARLPWNRERFGIVPNGKESRTAYKSIKHLSITVKRKKIDITLLELYPATGRTHQIRVHLKYINHPIIGDYLHAGRKTSRDDRLWASRVMLHAWKLRLVHPVSDQYLELTAPIPEDIFRIMNETESTGSV